MGTYLLLRDNKENGPYTLEQLLSFGLKAYDLVWINGRSAAWRYPSEIEELKPYAPVVEEQPFDRFYKKPAETVQPQNQVKSVQDTPQPVYQAYQPRITAQVEEKAEKKEPARKSVFVTLPATPVEEYIEPVQVPDEPTPTIKVVENKEAVQTKFSQPLDEIKEQYVKTLLERKQKISRRSVWMQQLRIAGIMVLLIGGGIFLGWTMSNRGGVPDLPGGPTPQLALAANQEEIPQADPAPEANQQDPSVQEGVVMSASAAEQTDVDIEAKEARDAAAKEARLRKIIANSPPPTPEEKMLGEVTAKKEMPPATTATSRGAKAVMSKADPQTAAVDEPDSYQRVTTNAATGERSRSSRDNAENDENKSTKRVNSNSALKDNNRLIASGRDVPREVTVLSNNYKRVPFGGIRDLRLTVYNRSDDPLEKVIVELKYMKPGDQVLKTQWIEFPAIDAKSSATLRMPDTNRGIDVTYQISSVVKAR